MTPLESLTREAAGLAAGARAGIPPTTAETEVARVMQICNACRYCEGFCAVFPAMTRRLEFGRGDVHYLANLCHNCGACLYACQYAPPHAFAVVVPQAMAVVRGQTYTDYAWPAALGALYRHASLTVALALASGLALFLVLGLALNGTLFPGPLAGDFYAVFPHNVLATMFGAVFVFAVLALGVGVVRFWRSVAPGAVSAPAAGEATLDVVRLTYLGGGHGAGCNNEDDAFTLWRRRFHHLTLYGFLLCFAATTVATFYHFALGRPAPYALASAPVMLGSVGGLGLLVGTAGLMWQNRHRDPRQGDLAQVPLDRGFMVLLQIVTLTGFALLAGRDGGAMALLLAVHLGTVMALFATLPYGKFAHGLYRAAALLKWAVEKRLPNTLQLTDE